MNIKYYSKNLDEGEAIVEVVRRHPITIFRSAAAVVIIVLLDFFFLTWLFAQGLWGVILFFFLLFLAFVLGLKAWVIWSKNIFIITNQRIIDIDQHGFFNKTVSECNYEKIQDISFTVKGVFATLFHFGSLQIQTAANIANLELNYIKNPARVQEVITDQQRDFLSMSKSVSSPAKELNEASIKKQEHLNEEELEDLYRNK